MGHFQKMSNFEIEKNLLKVTYSNNPLHKQIKTNSTLRTTY